MTASTASSSSASTKLPSKVSKQTKQKRNERERKRVDQVNQGFHLLKERVPKVAGSKNKMSKVETLREAARYIQKLKEQLGYVNSSMPMDFPTPDQSPIYPQSLCSMAPQTPSPSYMSPFYPAPQMMSVKPGSAQYYSGQENSSASSTRDVFFSNGEAY